MMARMQSFFMVVPALASMYNGLWEILLSISLSNCDETFPIHYVYKWLTEYFGMYFSHSTQSNTPLIVRFSGE